MAEIDPLIVELKAKVDQFNRDLERTTRRVEDLTARQRREVQRLEDQFRRSSGAIGSSLKGIAGTLAAGFSGRELVGLIDSYTRLQNSLKVTGLEGEALAQVQQRLFAVAQQNGVELEAVGQLYSRAAQNQKELGASTSDLINLTRAVAASLRISGTSTQEASGSLLQLGQALGSPRIQAEEFNSLLDTMQPLLREAAKNIEGTGGTLSGLTRRIKDVNGPGVTNVELFRAINQALADLEKQAASSQITLAGAFTKLSNALTTYVGEAANANGVTGALATGIEELAKNIDELVEIAAIVAVALGVRFAGGAAVAATQAIGLRVVALGLAASLNGTAAAATLAGRALLTAMTGPVGIAIGAIAVGLALVATRTTEAENAAAAYAKGQDVAAKASTAAREAAERLASAHGKTRAEALAAAKSEAELTKQKIASAKASLQQAQAELTRLQIANRRDVRAASLNTTGAGGGTDRLAIVANRDAPGLSAAERRVQEEQGKLDGFQKTLNDLNAVISANAPPLVSTGTGTGKPSGSSGSTPSGPSAADRLARFLDEQARLDAEILQAKLALATSTEERASIEREILSAQGDARRREIADQVKAKELTAEQAKALTAQIDALYGVAAQVDEQGNVIATFNNSLLAQEVAFREQAEIEQRNADLADERGRAAIDGLRLQFDLATTERDRRRIALDILKAEQAILREKLLAQINSKTLNDVDKERARIALAALDAQAAAQEESVKRQFANPLERFADRAGDAETRVQEAAVRRIEQLNATIADAMTNALGVEDPFLRELISIFLDKNIFGPLAEALNNPDLQGNGGGIIAGIGSLLGGLFGRSSGGRVNAGSIYRVNEGASPGRVEAFVPNTSGQIIPLGRMNAMQAGGSGGSGTVRVVIEEAPGFAARVRTEATGVAIEVTRQTAPQIIDAAANETLRRANRPSL